MISQTELDRFYEHLVATVRANGGVCAITSGMACVKYGVAISTKDCDLLCSVESTSRLFDVLATTTFAGASCAYRGHLTAPLDARWQRGGWTAHFQWKNEFIPAHLDVFGVAPRASSPWEAEQQEMLAGMHTVAEMKRTDRLKDWAFATALGMKLIEKGDERGWLHVGDDSQNRADDPGRELFVADPLSFALGFLTAGHGDDLLENFVTDFLN